MKFYAAIHESELWNGEKIGLEINNRSILLVKYEDIFYAYKNHCPHLNYALSAGELSDNILTCSLHHWQYDIKNGLGVNPSNVSLCSYPLKVEDGLVYIGFND